MIKCVETQLKLTVWKVLNRVERWKSRWNGYLSFADAICTVQRFPNCSWWRKHKQCLCNNVLEWVRFSSMLSIDVWVCVCVSERSFVCKCYVSIYIKNVPSFYNCVENCFSFVHICPTRFMITIIWPVLFTRRKNICIAWCKRKGH